MALIVLPSVNGSPGVSTTSLGLAQLWPRPAVVVDADPTGGMAIPAGYLRGAEIPAGRSLVDLSIAHRHGALADALPGMLLDLPDGRTKLLCGTTTHHQARVLEGFWEPLASALKALERTGQDVIVDAGRLGLEGSPLPLIAAADLCLLVVRSNLPAVVAANSWANTLRDMFDRAGAPSSLGLLVIDPDRPYSAKNVSKALQIPLIATLPWDPETAQHLAWGSEAPRWNALQRLFRRSGGLDRSLLAAVESIQAHLTATRAALGVELVERN
jgi:hypothetical protein